MLEERPLDQEEWVALFLDGKRFAEAELVIAVGVTVTGQKQVLGLVQTATENRKSCAAFLPRERQRIDISACTSTRHAVCSGSSVRAANAWACTWWRRTPSR
jgi:transposase-like protein